MRKIVACLYGSTMAVELKPFHVDEPARLGLRKMLILAFVANARVFDDDVKHREDF